MHDLNGPMDAERTDALLRALDACDGADATLVAVTASHAMLVLRLTPERGEPITLLCGACERIETNKWWRVVRLQYEVLSTAPYRYRLFDTEARFSVECGAVRVSEDPDDWKAGDPSGVE